MTRVSNGIVNREKDGEIKDRQRMRRRKRIKFYRKSKSASHFSAKSKLKEYWSWLGWQHIIFVLLCSYECFVKWYGPMEPSGLGCQSNASLYHFSKTSRDTLHTWYNSMNTHKSSNSSGTSTLCGTNAMSKRRYQKHTHTQAELTREFQRPFWTKSAINNNANGKINFWSILTIFVAVRLLCLFSIVSVFGFVSAILLFLFYLQIWISAHFRFVCPHSLEFPNRISSWQFSAYTLLTCSSNHLNLVNNFPTIIIIATQRNNDSGENCNGN